MRTRRLVLALTALLLLALAGLVAGWGERASTVRAALPASARPPLEFRCESCPDMLEGGNWVKVKDFLQWSGCSTWECWSEWNSQGPSALLEKPGDRLFRTSAQANPPGWPNPGHRGETVPCTGCVIWDGRDMCDTDGDGHLEAAAGTWYHNAFASPSWSYIREGAELILFCTWQIDRSKTYWNFAEQDVCQHQVCSEPTPPITVTRCIWEETPLIKPTDPPPQPTPFVPVAPSLTARAFVHSPLDPRGNAYLTAPAFYWNWQAFLHASLTAQVTEPTPPNCGASSEVVAYWFYGSAGQTVCPANSGDPDCRWRPIYQGGAHPDVARPEWLHLVWSRTATPATRPATWGFYPVGPVTVDIAYSVLVLTTYTCDGGANTYTAFWTQDLALQVGLLRTVRRY